MSTQTNIPAAITAERRRTLYGPARQEAVLAGQLYGLHGDALRAVACCATRNITHGADKASAVAAATALAKKLAACTTGAAA